MYVFFIHAFNLARHQIILARRPDICYTIRNIHFSSTAVSYEPADLLNPWKQVYIIYLGRGILGCFFYCPGLAKIGPLSKKGGFFYEAKETNRGA